MTVLNSPAHPCRYRRFACPLTGANARLAEKRGSVTPSFRGTCTPYLLPVRLAHQIFACNGPDQKWGVDISYVWTAEGWLYLAIVLDLFSRRIVSWATSDRLKRQLALEALHRAIVIRQPPPGLLHHSDRGAQYCSDDYQRLLKQAGMIPSISGKGNCYDNAMVETVFKTIKSELVRRTSFLTRRQAEKAIGRYIDGFYNPTRRHSALGYISPIKFEAAVADTD